jgi:NarL family two-component system response regulator LiaR
MTTILIVDDNEPMRRMIRGLLSKLVDEFHECSDGDEAVEAYVRLRPDWVVMDIKMGRMDGIEATRRIVAGFPDANVAIVTSFDEPGLERAALEAGARAWLLKEDLRTLRRLIAPPSTASHE